MHAYRKKSMYAFPAEGHSEDQNNFNMTSFLFNNVIAYFFFFFKADNVLPTANYLEFYLKFVKSSTKSQKLKLIIFILSTYPFLYR